MPHSPHRQQRWWAINTQVETKNACVKLDHFALRIWGTGWCEPPPSGCSFFARHLGSGKWSSRLLMTAHREVAQHRVPSLKLTWHLKMDGWNTSFLLGWTIFSGYVKLREGF